MNLNVPTYNATESSVYDDFDIIYPHSSDAPALIVMKISEHPLIHLTELQTALRSALFTGTVLIDQLLHSGNSEARFIAGVFDGASFDTSGFQFETVDASSPLRTPMCAFLRSDPETLEYSCLPTWDQESIAAGSDI